MTLQTSMTRDSQKTRLWTGARRMATRLTFDDIRASRIHVHTHIPPVCNHRTMEARPTEHPYTRAWRTRDLAAWQQAWTDDVRLWSPILRSPFEGRAAAAELFEVLFERLGDVEITHSFG